MIFLIFGRSADLRDMGAVAEFCPHCRQVGPCAVICRIDELHFFFLPVARNTTETTCVCWACRRRFPAGPQPFRDFVSLDEAAAMPVEELAEQTNPPALVRLEWSRQCQKFAGDSGFTAVSQIAEQLGPGQLRVRLEQGLEQWDRLDHGRRAGLLKSASDLERVLDFARTVADKVPGSSGCLAGLLACLALWAVFVGLVAAGYLAGGPAVGFACVVAGPLVGLAAIYWLQRRRFRRWVEEVVIPEGEQAGIDFAQLAAVLQESPASGLFGNDGLRPLRDEADNVVKALAASGKIAREGDGIDSR
jgi:hypothetical protein